MSSSRRWTVGPVRPHEYARWQELYQAYGAFYETAMPPDKLELVWSWLHDPHHEVHGLVVRDAVDGPPMGLAHYRPFARPLHGSVGCFLDDLFVDPAARGTGAVDALLAELARLAGRNGWDVVRWLTRESNTRARSAYDRLATLTPYCTYDLPPAHD